MPPTLPEYINPWKLARNGAQLEGALTLETLPRLVDAVHSHGARAEISWHFSLDEEGRPRLTGTTRAEVQLLCQRCLEPVTSTLDAALNLVVVHPGQTPPELDSPWEALEVADATISLAELVEDELLLALPLVPRHETCPRNQYTYTTEAGSEPSAENPFAALEALKRK